MDPYASDEEQVEAIKKWLKTNGGAIITGVALGIAAILSWQYWNSYQLSQAEQASIRYDALSLAVASDDLVTARQQAEDLINDYANTTYAALSGLMLAKFAAQENNNKSAIDYLQWVLNNSDQDEIKTIARLRLARIFIAETRLNEAATILEQINDPNFTAEVEELRGDVYLERNEPSKSRSAYEAARAALGNSSARMFLDMKLDNLPAASSQIKP